MRCPHCNLINPSTAQRCDCGYDFADKRMSTSLVEEARRRRGDESTAQAEVDRLLKPAIVFAVFWLFGAGSLLSIIYASRAQRLINRSRERLRGDTAATVCIIVSGVQLIIGIIWLAVRLVARE